MMQAALEAGNAEAVVFFLFDLLHLDGRGHRRAPAVRAQGAAVRLAGEYQLALALQRPPGRPRPAIPRQTCAASFEADYEPNDQGVKVADLPVINAYRSPLDRSPADQPNYHKSYGYLRTPEMSNVVRAFT